LGGDEFAILLADAQDVSTVELVCRRIVDSFATEVPFKGKTMRTPPSIGIAMFPADGETQDVLYKCADLALYDAKNTGRNTWRWYHSKLSV
jgi:diguanylate cyclase (GGDEF)-like protein